MVSIQVKSRYFSKQKTCNYINSRRNNIKVSHFDLLLTITLLKLQFNNKPFVDD